MTNIDTWNNELAGSNSSTISPSDSKTTSVVPENTTTKPGAQRYNQIVNNFKSAESKANLLKNSESDMKEGKKS